jgi:hypothetical protein
MKRRFSKKKQSLAVARMQIFFLDEFVQNRVAYCMVKKNGLSELNTLRDKIYKGGEKCSPYFREKEEQHIIERGYKLFEEYRVPDMHEIKLKEMDNRIPNTGLKVDKFLNNHLHIAIGFGYEENPNSSGAFSPDIGSYGSGEHFFSKAVLLDSKSPEKRKRLSSLNANNLKSLTQV